MTRMVPMAQLGCFVFKKKELAEEEGCVVFVLNLVRKKILPGYI